jgi:hypothetical protein
MPMEELTRRIRGDWFQIREASDDIHKLEDVFSFSLEELKRMVENVRLSVEQGITEYKTVELSAIYSYLESLQYDSRGLDALTEKARGFSFLLYAVLIQRLITNGSIKIKSSFEHENSGKSEGMAASRLDMKEILQEIQQRIAKKPEVRQHPAVTNIFMHVNRYKRELANMKKLAPNILPEKQQAFYANFKNTFNTITQKIQDNYNELLSEDRSEIAKEMAPTHPLKRYDLTPFEKLFFEQAKEFSLIRSTLVFAGQERYKTRDILASIVERKERVSMLVATEERKYAELTGQSNNGRSFSRAFGTEIITVLNRQITRIQ